MSDFSLDIPHLTYYLQNILRRYPLGGQILKELLQNAEDSNATQVKFFIDYSEYPCENLLHSGLAKFQGPALLAFNNSEFDETDFISIKNIEKSRKYDKPLKIGKFGLGFNSIYHLTDLPSIVSGNDMIMFDPHEKYFIEHNNSRRGIRFNITNPNDQNNFFNKYTDQFEPYKNIDFEKDSKIDFKTEFKGTLFRFPIRNQQAVAESKLCLTGYKDIDKIIYEDILESFFKDLNLILLFLRRIEKIEIFEIKNGKQNLIASTFINFEKSSKDLRAKREDYFKKLSQAVNQTDKTMSEKCFDLNDITNNYKLVIETSLLDRNAGEMIKNTEKYLISNYVKFKSASSDLRKMAFKTATFPACGVAYKLNNIDDLNRFKASRYFCFLPMPETIEKSGLPLHVNGSFGLRDDRRDFKWMSADAKEDESAKWNEFMVNEVLNVVLIQMISYAQWLIDENDSEFNIKEFYNLLPDLSNIGFNWKQKHLKSFLNNLVETDLILSRNRKWSNINKIYLTNKMDKKLDEYSIKNEISTEKELGQNELVNLKELIYDCFDPNNLSIIPVPEHVIKIYEEYNRLDNLKYIDELVICDLLRNNNSLNKNYLTDDQKTHLLNFLIQSINKISFLDDIQLLPLANSNWTFFKSNSQISIFYFDETEKNSKELFQCKLGSIIFNENKLNKSSKYLFLNNLQSNSNSNQIIKFDKSHFNQIINLIIKESFLEKKQENIDWLSLLWKYISDNFFDSLETIKNLHLVPKFEVESNRIQLYPLDLSQNNKILKYFYLNEQTDVSKELIEVFLKLNDSNGCILFKDLPVGLEKHPKIESYLTLLKISTLSDFFVHINSNKEPLKDFIDSKFDVNTRCALLEDLNTIKSFQGKNEFISILKDKIPIFNLYNQKKLFCTALECNYYLIEPNFKQHNLPIDPSIKLIDSSSCQNLTKNLDLQVFPLEELLNKSFDYFVKINDFNSINKLLEWIFLNGSIIRNYNIILNKQIFKDNSNGNEFKYLHEIYDPRDKFVNLLIPNQLHLNEELNKEPFYSSLKNYLIKSISSDYFEMFIQKLEYNEPDYDQKIQLLFELLNSQPELIVKTFKYKWLKINSKLYQSTDLWDPEFEDLIGYVKPIVDYSLVPFNFRTKLGINKEKPNLDDVILNYKHILTLTPPDLKIIDKIYSYFNNIESKKLLKDKLTNYFVYDGIDSFCNPKNLIINSDISDLSPFMKVIQNKSFVNKYQSLYFEVFEIKKELNLELLIQILQDMNSNKSLEIDYIKKAILVRSIFNLIQEKYENQLLNDSNLRQKILIPVIDFKDDLKIIEFERIEKCVYLIEEESDQNELKSNRDEAFRYKKERCLEKGFKICDECISTRFLKKIGVCSFTEKVMNIENMSIESCGQHEEITDRIRTLLDGYKDGISIFKEAIQNADDAGATVVKFCYDKRTNDKWKNPNQLLDSGLVGAQGPAILIYNDATFTDADFVNVTRLGAGTKKDSKETIGKFGLGLNTFYNVTDLLTILSRNTMILFDPNIKFLKERIKNVYQPGIRINLNSLKNQDLKYYSDQFMPFQNIFGCNMFENNFNYPGTLFRLPLRTESSKISTKIYNDEEVSSSIEILLRNADSLLLFTQSVKKLEFYVINEETEQVNLKLIFKFENSPINYLKKHNLNLNPDEFISQSSILKASALGLKNQYPIPIETSLIVKNKIEFDFKNLKTLRLKFNYETLAQENYWLIVSNFDPLFLVKNDSDFINFIPCVGAALKLSSKYSNFNSTEYSLANEESAQAFCFLPLSIDTNLRYHINGPFLLSEDRLNFYEKSQDDKCSSNKYKWNDYLLEPLVKNILKLIVQLNDLSIDKDKIIEHLWPINNQKKYFKNLEDKFYDKICQFGTNLQVFPKHFNEQGAKFGVFDQAIFVDFDFKSKEIQEIGLNCLNLIEKSINSSNYLVCLPNKYLEKIKTRISSTNKFINDFEFLKKMINYKNVIEFKNYEKILRFYLNEKCFNFGNVITNYGILIKENGCIPTCNKMFKYCSNLYDPQSNEYFRKLLGTFDDIFPSDFLCSDRKTIDNLIHLGLKTRFLDDYIVENLARRVESLQNTPEAKNLSKNLANYLSDYFKNGLASRFDPLKSKLRTINWIFSKEKPSDWHFPWYEQKSYKQSEIFSDKYQLFICAVKPLFDSTYSFLENELGEDQLLIYSLEQFKFLINYYVLNEYSMSNIQKREFDYYFQKFYLYLQDYSTENKNIDKFELERRINFLKYNLPHNWIYIAKNSIENRFLPVNNFAFDVSNPYEPDLLRLDLNDHRERNFFKVMGVIENFSLETLRLKLFNLKNKFYDQPLDEVSFEKSLKITNEMIYIDENRKDLDNLNYLLKNKDFFFPDENRVMRDLKTLCYERSISSLSLTANLFNLYVLNSAFPNKKLGIESLKNKAFGRIGEAFGQKESLLDRIKDILGRYPQESCIFKELIQNADDAKASKICFILDERYLKTENTFGTKFNALQGPALCCFNDSIFSENNLKGIISLGQGSKKLDPNKIGQFGVGFNSVYHLTDAPQFISNLDDYVIFDPLCQYFPDIESDNPGCRIKNAKKYLKDTIFRDVLSGFEIPGFNLENNTMFRLPLRTKNSDISKTYNTDKVMNLITNFLNSSKETLLFLRNIKEISFYTLTSNGRLELINQDIIYLSKEDIHNRELFYSKVDHQLTEYFAKISIESLTLNVVIKSQKSQREFLVFEQIGFDSSFPMKDLIYDLSLNRKAKFFPMAAIAINKETIKNKNFKENYMIYNYLPLNQKSPFKLHLHGNWALHQENRTHLYEYGMRNENVQKQDAKWFTDWNLCLINLVICPLYLKMIKFIQENSEQYSKEKPKEFIQSFLDIFPNITSQSEELKPYFESMCKEFYLRLLNMNSVPIIESLTISWSKPINLLFTQNFEASFLGNSDELCEIVKKCNINICRYNNLIGLFKNNASYDLPQLNPKNLIDGLKTFKNNLIYKELKDTVFRSTNNYRRIFDYCRLENLEGAPLLLKQDLKLATFSSSNKIIDFHSPKLFKGYEHLFLNKDFDLNIENKSFLRSIQINDLTFLLRCFFSLEKNFLPDIHKISDYPKLNYNERQFIILIWEIITKSINFPTHSGYPPNKANILASLAPIKNWTLIPVRINDSNETLLAPIMDLNKILSYTTRDLIYDIVRTINYPVFDTHVLHMNLNTLVESLTVVLSRIEDFLIFIKNFNSDYKLLFNRYNISIFLKYLNDSIHYRNNSFDFKLESNLIRKHEIIDLIKILPIFEDIFDCIETIKNQTLYLINFDDLSTEMKSFLQSKTDLIKFDLKDYANHVNIIIAEYKRSYSNLYSFMGLRENSIKDLYIMYFKWVLGQDKTGYNVFKEHILHLKSLTIKKLKTNTVLWDLLKSLPFIKINNNFYKASECFDHKNILFQHVYKDKLLPEEYQIADWTILLIELGLNIECNVDQCIYIANKLKELYLKKEIDINTLNNCVQILFTKNIPRLLKEPNNVSLIDQIKSIKFVPNYFNFAIPNIQIEDPVKIHGGLICLSYSTFEDNQDLAWLVKPILPWYCRIQDDIYIKSNSINYEITSNFVIANFVKVITLLTNENDILNKMDFKKIEILNNLLNLYYDKFLKYLKNSTDKNELQRLEGRKMILVKSKLDKRFKFVQCDLVVRFMNPFDQIDEFIYKLPGQFSKYSKLFQHLGTLENPTFERCQSILQYYYNLKKPELNQLEYTNVLIVYKMLFYDDLMVQKNLPRLKLYAPNLFGQMKEINQLYYMDKSAHERLIQNCDEIKQITLFDLKLLIDLIQNSLNYFKNQELDDQESDELNKQFTMKQVMFNQLSWATFFQTLSYFQQNLDLSPKPLSNILVEKVIAQDEGTLRKDKIKSIQISEESFQNAVIECLKLLNNNLSIEPSTGLRDQIKSMITKISVYSIDEIKTFFVNLNTGRPIENSERVTNITRIKSEDETKFLIKNDFNDDSECSFYLAEAILEVFQGLFASISNQNDLEFLSNILKKYSHRLVYLLMKLLQNQSDNYQKIIDNYKLNAPFNIA